MNYKFKGVHKGIFYFTLIIIPWCSTNSAEVDEEITFLQVNEAKLGENCGNKVCSAKLFCDVDFICKCLPGYEVFNNDCVLFAGENEKCTRQEDCEKKLFCINGICRKPNFNNEFAALAKICLGITITTIIIAAFSSLLKCFTRYEASRIFQRQSDTSIINSTPAFNRNIFRPEPNSYEIRDEKPPSYEECIRSSDPPPPYIISNNPAPVTVGTPISQPTNVPTVNSQNETPLSVQNLNQNINSK